MSDELIKFVSSVAVSVGGVWVALHKKMENIATRLKAAEDDVRDIKIQNEPKFSNKNSLNKIKC